MNRPRFRTRCRLIAGLFQVIVILCLTHNAYAKVQNAVLEVDLKNPGDSIGTIIFTIQSSQLTGKIVSGISVSSPAGQKNLFPAGSVVFDRHPDYVIVTITPTKAFAANQNIKFVVTVPGVNSISVITQKMNNNGTILSPPLWYNNTDPPKIVSPAPELPAFTVTAKDASYMVFDSTSDPFGIDDLQFLPNLTPAGFDALNLDSIIAETPESPADLTPPWSSDDFANLPDPDPGNYFIADGQILDQSGDVIGAFAEGIQVAPEPASASPLMIGLAAMLFIIRHRSRVNPWQTKQSPALHASARHAGDCFAALAMTGGTRSDPAIPGWFLTHLRQRSGFPE